MSQSAITHLQNAIQAPTISYPDRSRMDFAVFERFLSDLKTNYPLTFSQGIVERVADYSLLITLNGTNPTLDPVAFMGHYDVVPVKPEGWITDPFSGEIKDGYLYGRGTLDMKGQVIATLEAMEALLADKVSFERSIYLLFGHNEETGSEMNDSGATLTRDLLKSRGIHFYAVIDEGGAVIEGKDMGIEGLVGMIGIAEKGYLDLKLSAKQSGGHASMPPERSALYDVFEGAMTLESKKFDAAFNAATRAMFTALAPHMKGLRRFTFSHLDWFEGFVLKQLIQSPQTAALVRTTSVMTMASGSKAPNVLAQTGEVIVNCRLVPGDSVAQVVARTQAKVGPKVKVEVITGTEPTDVSPVDHPAFVTLQKSIQSIYPELKVLAPYLVVGATDSRVYHGMADGVYRIQPFLHSYQDRGTVHADNERILIEDYLKGITLFKTLMTELSKAN